MHRRPNGRAVIGTTERASSRQKSVIAPASAAHGLDGGHAPYTLFLTDPRPGGAPRAFSDGIGASERVSD
jgi:hypothetical protein